MVKGTEFRRATLFVALALAAAPGAALAQAQDARYVPAYEPSYVPASASPLGAYSLAGAFSLAVVDTADNGRAEVKPQPADAPAAGPAALAQTDAAPQPAQAAFVQAAFIQVASAGPGRR